MPTFVGNHRGLTLVEVMAVLAVSGLLLTGIWRVYHDSMRAYQRGLQDTRSTRGARTVLRLLTRDIQQALAAAVPHGIQGTNHQYSPTADADRLELMTVTHPASDAQSIRYLLEPAAGDGTLALKRAVITRGNQATERMMPLSERLASLNLRYFDGQQWYDAWQRAALPKALEVTVVFQPSGREPRTSHFTTMVTAE
jgi:prepilin-type N-terminal cleavage/methylation domain-containing protein